MAHIDIQSLSFSYPNAAKKALDDVNLSIQKGEYVVLCGQSGSGKSTLLRHLKTVLTPHGTRNGSIRYDNTELSLLDQKTQACAIGFVMQNPDEQIVTDQVWHELAFGLESIGCEQNTMRLRVAEMASYFGIQGWFYRNIDELSGGQKQLVNLASIMAMQPQVLILDEPTSQLDPLAASDFLNTVRKINLELGTTVIITEHRLEDIYHAADRVVVMENGKILADGSPRSIGTLLHKRSSPMFAALPTPVRVFYEVGTKGEAPLTVREGRRWLANALAKHSIRHEELKKETQQFAVSALRIKNVWFRYEKDSPDVLQNLDVSVPGGCLFAIVGGNGTGKSTMLKAICGICKPYRGKIEILGKDSKKHKDLFHNCISMLPQDPTSLFSKTSVREELEEMSHNKEKVSEIAALCDISALLDSHPFDLSGGEQQRTALAKVLLTHPKLLLLDEPTKGLDSEFKHRFAKLLCKLKNDGITVVMVSHDVEFCAEYADFVSMFFDGQILTTQTPHEFFGANSFYTTAANRMSRSLFRNAVTANDIVQLYRLNLEDTK